MMKLLNCKCGEKMHALAPFFLRVVAGAIFVAHGWSKYVRGIEGTTGMLAGIGFPAPEVFAVILIAAEIGGGILLILGAYTHWAAKLTAFVALVAFLTVHMAKGWGNSEFVLLLLAASVSLMITGPGRWSVDHILRKKQ